MTKKNLIDGIAASPSLSNVSRATIERVLDAMSEKIKEALQMGEDVPLLDLGKLRPKLRGARTSRNPRTGAEVNVPARMGVKFMEGQGLKQALK